MYFKPQIAAKCFTMEKKEDTFFIGGILSTLCHLTQCNIFGWNLQELFSMDSFFAVLKLRQQYQGVPDLLTVTLTSNSMAKSAFVPPVAPAPLRAWVEGIS